MFLALFMLLLLSCRYIWFMSDMLFNENYSQLLGGFIKKWNTTFRSMGNIIVCCYYNNHKVNGRHILWSHLIDLYNWSREESGLYIGNQLKLEHIKLTSYSRMNVRLAAQVCH